MSTLDFSELGGKLQGEAFEALVRLIGERLGMIVQWSGRGADGGRDLFFIEQQQGALARRTIKWLVSCKDHSASGASVKEGEVGSIVDKLTQHRCEGFLLATTTTASTGLKERLDRLDVCGGGTLHTKVWDRFEITRYLGEERFAALRQQFFPRHTARANMMTIDAAREIIETSLPRVAAGHVRRHLVSRSERLAQLDGARVWPADPDQRRIIDRLKIHAIDRHGLDKAIDRLTELHFDAFVAFMDALIRNFPADARRLLAAAAAESHDDGFLFNAIDMLREFDDFSQDDEIELARRCDPDTLHEMYRDTVVDGLMKTSRFDGHLPPSILRIDDDVHVDDVSVSDVEFSGGSDVRFTASVKLNISGYSMNPEQPPAGQATFPCTVRGYLTGGGIEIDRVADDWA